MSTISLTDRQNAAIAQQVALRGALQHIEREFGKGTLMRMGDAGAQVHCEAIPTGALSLDLALGIGGVPRGRIVEVYGPESSGKTTLVYHVLAQAQALGGVCAFIDAEHSMDPLYAARSGLISTSCSSPSPTMASRRWRSPTCWCARGRWTSSRSTLSRR